MRINTRSRTVRGREAVMAALGDLDLPDEALEHLKDELGEVEDVSLEIGNGTAKIIGKKRMKFNGGDPDFDIGELAKMLGGEKKEKDGSPLALKLLLLGTIAATELLAYARKPEAQTSLLLSTRFGRTIMLAHSQDNDRYEKLNERMGQYGVDLMRIRKKVEAAIETRSVSAAQAAVEAIGHSIPVLLRVMLDAAEDAEQAATDIRAI